MCILYKHVQENNDDVTHYSYLYSILMYIQVGKLTGKNIVSK